VLRRLAPDLARALALDVNSRRERAGNCDAGAERVLEVATWWPGLSKAGGASVQGSGARRWAAGC